MEVKNVLIKSAWVSKVNWTQAVAMLAMLLTMFGIDMPEDVRVAILAAITAISTVLTWILRTFFTTELTKPSVK